MNALANRQAIVVGVDESELSALAIESAVDFATMSAGRP